MDDFITEEDTLEPYNDFPEIEICDAESPCGLIYVGF